MSGTCSDVIPNVLLYEDLRREDCYKFSVSNAIYRAVME